MYIQPFKASNLATTSAPSAAARSGLKVVSRASLGGTGGGKSVTSGSRGVGSSSSAALSSPEKRRKSARNATKKKLKLGEEEVVGAATDHAENDIDNEGDDRSVSTSSSRVSSHKRGGGTHLLRPPPMQADLVSMGDLTQDLLGKYIVKTTLKHHSVKNHQHPLNDILNGFQFTSMFLNCFQAN